MAVLLNSYAFAAASLDRIDDAVKAISKIRSADAPPQQRLISIANSGLIPFRGGDTEVGRDYYRNAIDGFSRNAEYELAARAKIYLAREAMRAGTNDWRHLLKDAQSAMGKFKDSPALVSLRIVEEKASSIDASENSLPENQKTKHSDEISSKLNIRIQYDSSSFQRLLN